MNGRLDDPRASNGRSDPVLGELRDLDAPSPAPGDRLPPIELPPSPRRAQRRPRRRPWQSRWVLAGAALVVVLLLAVWLGQNRLRDLVPRTELNDVLGRADTALREGRLEGSDGTSARELYQVALEQEPDNDRARDGLRQVGLSELSRADAEFRAGHLAQAQQALDDARELLGGGSDVDHLGGLIARARSTGTPADDLLARAGRAMADGRLAGDDGAAALYHRLLVADPGNAVAMHGLEQVGDALAARARGALAAGDTDAAARATDELAGLLPSSADLPGLRAALAEAGRKRQSEVESTLAQGDQALRDGRVSGDGDDTALAYYRHALALDPGNAGARAGLERVAGALTVRAQAALDDHDTGQAKTLLDQAAAIAPDADGLAGLRQRLARALAPPPPPPPPALTPEQHDQVTRLIARAGAAAAAGRFLLPPGEGAFDLYRNALAIDQNSAAAQQGLDALPQVAIGQFNQALAHGDLAAAEQRLDALTGLAPDNPAGATLRRRLADAWLDRAEQRMAGNDRAGAMQAIDQARRLAPLQPRIDRLAAQLQDGG